jgi:hypothetical protein
MQCMRSYIPACVSGRKDRDRYECLLFPDTSYSSFSSSFLSVFQKSNCCLPLTHASSFAVLSSGVWEQIRAETVTERRTFRTAGRAERRKACHRLFPFPPSGTFFHFSGLRVEVVVTSQTLQICPQILLCLQHVNNDSRSLTLPHTGRKDILQL